MKKLYMLGIVCLAISLLSGKAMAISITTSTNGNTLVNSILGIGINVSNVNLISAPNASGTFTDGLSSGIGIESGIILTSGNANLAVGPNTLDDPDGPANGGIGATGDNGLFAGDPMLDAIVFPGLTFDATVLGFDFESNSGNVFFNYVFASEEYNEFVNTGFNDVFAFFLDGQNIALIPGTNIPVSINNVNGGNPFGTNASNPQFYNNNDLDDGGPFFDIEYDGFTNVFTAYFLGLTPGQHNIKLAIADTGDFILDSAVFIQAGSFAAEPIPEPSTIILMGLGVTGILITRFRKKKKKQT